VKNKELFRQINTIIKKHIDTRVYKPFIFGSFAEKTQKNWSDIDVGIENINNKPLPAGKWYDILEELEENLNTHHKFDLVDFSKTTESFKKVAKLKVIYLK